MSETKLRLCNLETKSGLEAAATSLVSRWSFPPESEQVTATTCPKDAWLHGRKMDMRGTKDESYPFHELVKRQSYLF